LGSSPVSLSATVTPPVGARYPSPPHDGLRSSPIEVPPEGSRGPRNRLRSHRTAWYEGVDVVDDAEAMSRRGFLRHSAAAVVLCAAPASLLRSTTASAFPSLTRSRFAPALGTTFTMTDGTEVIEVVLTEIVDLVPVLRAHDEDRFALMFEAPPGRLLPDGIRTFGHPSAGLASLFVSPVDRDRSQRLQAVINRAPS